MKAHPQSMHACCIKWLAIATLVSTFIANPACCQSADAGELAAIMAGLESDAIATADQLLALDRQVDQDPAMVNSFVLTARAMGRQGQWQKSIDLLQRARTVQDGLVQITASPSKPNAAAFLHTIDLTIAAAAMQIQRFEVSKTHCDFVLADSTVSATYYAAASPMRLKAMQAMGELEQAAKALEETAQDPRASSIANPLGDIALSLGAVSLEKKQPIVAEQAYQVYLTLLPEGPRVADATLGLAWAAVLGSQSQADAASALLRFVDKYPKHGDAPHALHTAAICLDQIEDVEKADAVRQRLLAEYATSEAAAAILEQYQNADAPWPASVRATWLQRLASQDETSSTLTTAQVATVLNQALDTSDDELWQAAVRWLIKCDDDGSKTQWLLQHFSQASKDSIAEHLAIDLIARAEPASEQEPANEASVAGSPSASEAACRWAGQNERWSMLALAADELGPPGESSGRSVAIDRMLAESLMQTQRPVDAMPWWAWLIDRGGANDFATLLRGAETAVAHGDIETATKRVEAATLASGSEPFHRALSNILAAELAIRRARFDEARDRLTEIVRASEPSPSLRPRAQWLIGETYFMQQKYADAIDAYRRVDSMDDAGQWAPAALLQAGKAFEKLGRAREATVCYTALITRFRDWPHSGIAQSRLAALQPTEDTRVLR